MKSNRPEPLAGRTSKYEDCTPRYNRGLDASRKVEWDKWMEFNAGQLIRGELLKELLAEGHRLIPTQWIEIDKNAHLQKLGKYIKADFKSRLVGCGQYEDTTELRTDPHM